MLSFKFIKHDDLPMTHSLVNFRCQPSISCSLADAQLATARSLGSAPGCAAAASSVAATPATLDADVGEALGTAWANLGCFRW